MKLYYVYKITFSDNRYYIGYRGTCQDAKSDFLVKYFSSSKPVNTLIESGATYSGEILHENLCQTSAYELEQHLIYDHINDPMCLNQTCYFGRNGFGILSDKAKHKLSEISKERWASQEYKAKLSHIHKQAWTDARRRTQSTKLKGTKRPKHAELMKSKDTSYLTRVGLTNSTEHNKSISAALKGKPKSAEHRQKLAVPKVRVTRIIDRKEMSVNSFTRWLNSLAAV